MMKTEIRTRTILITLIVIACIPMVAAAQTASFKSLGLLHSANRNNNCFAVSADGSTILDATLDVEKGYQAQRRQNNRKSLLPISAQSNQQYRVLAMSADASAVVGFDNTAGGIKAFLLKDGTKTYLGGVGSGSKKVHSRPTAVSNNGSVVVGNYILPTGAKRAFRWHNGKMTDLGNISGEPDNSFSLATDVSADGSMVVGNVYNGTANQAFLWENGTMTGLGFLIDESFKPQSHAAAISADGSVAVGYGTTEKGRRACRWNKFGASVLETSNSIAQEHLSEAVDVSADGSVIVGNYLNSERSGVFIWDSVNKMCDLAMVLKHDYRLDIEGWRLQKVFTISEDGKTIIGRGTDSKGTPQAWVVTIP